MEKTPNTWKVPTSIKSVDQDPPDNHPENVLFGFLGALCAAIIGLSLYQSEIEEHLNLKPITSLITGTNPARAPASVPATFDPYEYFPYLY